MTEVATTNIDPFKTQKISDFFFSSCLQAAECNQTRAGQEDQQTAHPHRWTGKETLSSVKQTVCQSDKLTVPCCHFRTTCQSSCGAVRSWAWGAHSCLTLEICKTLLYELTSGTLTATANSKMWTLAAFSLFFTLLFSMSEIQACLNIHKPFLLMSLRCWTPCSGSGRLPAAVPPTVAQHSTSRSLKGFSLKWRWWVN